MENPSSLNVLRHLPYLTIPLARLLARPTWPRWVRPQFFHEVLAVHEPDMLRTIESVLCVLDQMDAESARICLPRPASLAELVGALKLSILIAREAARMPEPPIPVSRQFLARQPKSGEGFPHSPFPPPPGSIQISNLAMLLQEARGQQICVDTYRDALRNGKTILFRMVAPERATFEILRHPEKAWILGQTKLARNVPVTTSTRSMLKHWLDACLATEAFR